MKLFLMVIALQLLANFTSFAQAKNIVAADLIELSVKRKDT